MLASSKPCRRILNSINAKFSCFLCRKIHATRPTRITGIDGDHVPTAPTARKPKVTKKKISELPNGFLSRDGTVAPPFGDWPGGLGVPKDLTTSSSPSESTLSDVNFPAHKESSTKRKRRKKIEVGRTETDVPSTRIRSSHIRVQNGSGSSRRVTQTADTMDQDSSLSSSTPPRNMLAVEILANLAKFPHCLLLTRVGSFYESYFDQAIDISRLLNIKLISRVWDKQNIAMCGFPLMHLDKYLKILVQQNKRFVAICEEFPKPHVSGQKPEFDRRVTRVITPGTLIDESFLNHYENNYLLAISPTIGTDNDSHTVGLAWIDISNGDFFTKTSSHEALKDELARISPCEIVMDKKFKDDSSHSFHDLFVQEGSFVSYMTPRDPVVAPGLEQPASQTDDLTGTDDNSVVHAPSAYTVQEADAIKLLSSFLQAHLLDHMPLLSTPNREGTEGRMQIDAHTIKSLEIRERTREGEVTGSLLSVIKRTVTSSGTRLLARWLCSPSASLTEINARQSLVAFFNDRPHLQEDMIHLLSDVGDASRIVQKFLLNRGDPSDLTAINGTIASWTSVQKRIQLERNMEQMERGALKEDDWASIDTLMSRMNDLSHLSRRINLAIESKLADDLSPVPARDELADDIQLEGPAGPTADFESGAYTKWIIKPEFSGQLTALHKSFKQLFHRREELQSKLQTAYDAPSLTLRSSPALGIHVHIAKSRRDQAKVKASPLFVNISESGTTSSYFHQAWSQLGSQIVNVSLTIASVEREAFIALRDEVISFSSHLRRNARILDELDVTLAFAKLAAELKLVRPTMQDNTIYDVANGRHPTVELGLLTSGRVFTPNSVVLKPDSLLHIITGPNMGGKSTLLRQTALICILAQAGSFVPAEHAEIGVVDRLFSRVGAKDDLFRDRSTFMVEMLETAEILRRATPQSLIIMDEVGRGTTVKDGLAIAFATIHHLVTVNRCRALFATHFHELADLLGYCSDQRGQGIFGVVRFFCTDVDETEDQHFAYSHLLKPGVNRDSHGLKVAQMAGMPEPAMTVAENVLSALKSSSKQLMDASELAVLGQSYTASGKNSEP